MIIIHSHSDQNIGIEADPRCFRYCHRTKNKKCRRNEGSVINMLLSQTDAVFTSTVHFQVPSLWQQVVNRHIFFYILSHLQVFFSIQYYSKIKTLDAII